MKQVIGQRKIVFDGVVLGITQTYREAVSAKCRELLDEIVKPVIAVRYVVALGKRDLLWELLPDTVLPNVLEVRHGK